MRNLPFGPLILFVLGVGLAGYATLNLTGAFNDPEDRGFTLFGIVVRAADAMTGALYLALAAAALAIVVAPEKSGVDMAVAWASTVLALPFGSVLLGMIGVSLFVGAGYLLFRVWGEPFGNRLDRRALSGDTRSFIATAARIGTAARSVIFGICGFFVIRAAAAGRPEKVADVGDALSAIGATFFGPMLLVLAGTGFVAYGGYQLAKARYQRITVTSD
jgi:hypothetical protein